MFHIIGVIMGFSVGNTFRTLSNLGALMYEGNDFVGT